MENKIGDLNALLQEKLDADNDFQASLADMSDEDKEAAIATKKSELAPIVFAEKDEYARNQKIRAEKAEQEAKQLKTKPKENEVAPENEPLSQKDIIYLAKADIHEDDLGEVIEYSKFKKVSVAEAHKMMKPILAEHAEHRKTAEAANAGGGRGVVKKIDPSVIERNLSEGQGEVPKKGTEEAEELFWQRRGGRPK